MEEQLDPHAANVGFTYAEYAEGYVGRAYYWYDPEGTLATVSDEEIRRQHPEIDASEWERLFYEAFARGEREFVRSLEMANPDLLATPEGQSVAALGSLFGPKRPRSSQRRE